MRLLRITGSGFVKTGAVADGHPVEFRHWQEVVDECDRELESAADSGEDEAVVELWLEDPMSFQAAFDGEEPGAAPQIRTGGMLRRADSFGRKQAVVRETSWDEEFADAQRHVASVLGKLGNGR
jgi:hypothetical protein